MHLLLIALLLLGHITPPILEWKDTEQVRWRLSGSTWELTPSLVTLARQVDEAWPAGHPADGTLGNVSHSSRTSDHNPDAEGIVRALDIGEVVENDAMIVAEAVRLAKDKRIKYVIHEARMYSYYWKNGIAPFTWRTYTGTNLHWQHVHFSTRPEYDGLTTSWDIGMEGGDKLTPEQEKALNYVVEALANRSTDSPPWGARQWEKFKALWSVPPGPLNVVTHIQLAHIYDKLDARLEASVDSKAREDAAAAHARLDKLRQI